MEFIGFLFDGTFRLPTPTPLGWVTWFLFLGAIGAGLYRWRSFQPPLNGRFWGYFFGLLIFVPILNLIGGVRLPAGSALPVPSLPVDTQPPALMPLSALPWMLAAGPLGPFGAAALGALAGLLRGAWDTHSLFSILDLALLAALFAVNVRQRYRTLSYRIIRQPLVSALLLIPLHTLIYMIGAFFSVPGIIAVRIDYALSNAGAFALAFSGEALIGGLVIQVLVTAFPSAWGRNLPLQPSPAETSLESRYLTGTGSIITLLLLTLLIGDWVVAGRAARNMLEKRLASAAESAAQTVPFFLETGHSLASQIAADPRLLTAADADLSTILAQSMRVSPYFDEIVVLDAASHTTLGGHPQDSASAFQLFPEEDAAVTFAAEGVPVQIYTIPPAADGSGAARVSFVVGVGEANQPVQRVLVGRTDLGTNPLSQPLISSLEGMGLLEGSGMVMDDEGIILYHPNRDLVMTPYEGTRGEAVSFSTDTSPDGTRQYVYYQPVPGRGWAVTLAIPAWQAQQLALGIAAPLSGMILLLAVIALVSLRVGLRVVTGSLQTLAVESNRIAQGKLDHPLAVEGVDEVGQLRRAFEQMRVSLQARLDELNRLLVVSQGVASSLEMQDAVKPVLEAALASGASAVRVVLSPAILPKTSIELPSRFSLGPAGDKYAHMDKPILRQIQQQERIVLPNVARTRTLDLDPNLPLPASLLAVPLRHENRFYGVMWAAYDQPRTFTESDARFVTTLAGQAALATANAHLFLNVEAGRRQLEAILHSTPDPVLVIDPQNRLMLANPAARRLVGAENVGIDGQLITAVIEQQTLLQLLQAAPSEKQQSAEVVFPGGRTYLATASSVMAEGRPVGRVCVLRDVTHFKELDSMKSEFVATVSHDLRSPLTLMRGYATMLEMVGELNEQQQGYVRKIISGVENMSRLVNNLLDLGRIEIGVGLQVENVAVRDIVERVVGALQLQANQKGIALNVAMEPGLPEVIEADQALLHQGIYNLVENAIKYTPNDGQVSLRVYADPTNVTFEIRDNGIGVAPSDLAHLFEKFYRGKQREARAQHGTGLGLAIVRSIAERHGGKAWAESELGKGSAFFLQAPLTQPKGAGLS